MSRLLCCVANNREITSRSAIYTINSTIYIVHAQSLTATICIYEPAITVPLHFQARHTDCEKKNCSHPIATHSYVRHTLIHTIRLLSETPFSPFSTVSPVGLSCDLYINQGLDGVMGWLCIVDMIAFGLPLAHRPPHRRIDGEIMPLFGDYRCMRACVYVIFQFLIPICCFLSV